MKQTLNSGKKSSMKRNDRNSIGKGNFHSMNGAQTSSPKLYSAKASPGPKNVYNNIYNHRDSPAPGNLLTPKAEYYKQLVDQYKRTLDGLN